MIIKIIAVAIALICAPVLVGGAIRYFKEGKYYTSGFCAVYGLVYVIQLIVFAIDGALYYCGV